MAISNASRVAPRILVLEDSALDAELILTQLETLEPKPVVRRAVSRGTYLEALEDGVYDVILSDFSLPDFDGMAALAIAHSRLPHVPFIFVSGMLGEEVAIESFRHGATDYVLKQRLIRLPAAVERALAEARERAERQRVEQQKELLVRELSHRVKNTMAMVMSIVRRTAKTSVSIEDYVDTLLGRLRAMADAHALLFETNWSEAELFDILARTIAPQDRGGRFAVAAGPLVHLDPKAALALSLVFNELTSNAVKHGALSNMEGRISVGWELGSSGADDGMVMLRWRETGGPAVTPPKGEGFGTTLISRTLVYELNGTASLDFASEGLVCDLIFPLVATDPPAPRL